MNFVTWSIRNPVPVIVLFIALTAAGLISFPKLGVLDRPDIEFPAVVVTVTVVGAPFATTVRYPLQSLRRGRRSRLSWVRM